jgi:thiamine-phosphate pyrophosphorylase
MRKLPVLCYITDQSGLPGDAPAQRAALLQKIGDAARAGIDFVQLREKNLSGRELEKLTTAAIEVIRRNHAGTLPFTRLLVNGRADVALATAADGVHLPTHSLPIDEVRALWAQAGRTTPPIISVACHTAEDVRAAADSRADFALFAPVLGKKDAPSTPARGLEGLREACLAPIPVLALGGITLDNAADCLRAGAAGIAVIRLFQENEIADVVESLRT